MLRKNLKPVLEVVKKVSMDEWRYWERYYIQYYKDTGHNIINHTDGGDGLSMGNQTSFRKGIIPWNTGTKDVIMKNCENKSCAEVFYPKDKRRRFCSRRCSAKVNTGFRSEHVPWNRGVTGYNTSKKGYIMSEDAKQKISSKLKGRLNIGPSKPVLKIDKNNNKVIEKFPSAAEAARQTNINHQAIINTTNGLSISAGGYGWRKGV